ncbi:hybrid sensor histidine kinase/response regulator [Pseudazoarcus pumilus]|nr:hybrid sensor histidine kinase/response regulator [Pseudazoarcus pumilus]
MKNWGVRARVLLVAVLPMLVVALLLTAFYTSSRIDDVEQAHAARGKAYARQLVAASEYAVFSGNHDALQKLTEASLAEEGMAGVIIIDLFGETLARSGQLDEDIALARELLAESDYVSSKRTLRVIEPIYAGQASLGTELNDEAFRSGSKVLTPTLGNVVVDLSRSALDAQRRDLLRTGMLTVLAALVGTLLLATSMSRGVSGPIRRVADAVSRIGKGQFDQRVPIVGGGSLRMLAEGVNEMAEELAGMHAQMRGRISEATAELRERKEEAERANMAKSRFLAAASHDLRQPMHALGLFISELSQCRLDAPSRHLLGQITASAEAMEDLLDSLLDISRLDAGVLQASVRAFPLQPVLERIAATQRAAASDARVTLRIRHTDAWGVSDPVLFERILGNLVSNAVRYSPAGKVLVACRRRGDTWRIEVRDNGIGIPQHAQENIFQEFVQLQNPERSRDKGLGLGLAIVRRLTAMLDHPLELRSTPGRGSAFAVTIPAGRREDVVDAPAPEREPGDLGGLRVALVEDDPLVLSAMHSLLTSWGCDMVAAPDLELLVDRLNARGGAPNAIISDHRLARGASGAEVIREVRRRYGEDLPAALITGDTGPDALALAEREGLPVLHKPVRPARLRALLNRIAANVD